MLITITTLIHSYMNIDDMFWNLWLITKFVCNKLSFINSPKILTYYIAVYRASSIIIINLVTTILLYIDISKTFYTILRVYTLWWFNFRIIHNYFLILQVRSGPRSLNSKPQNLSLIPK